MAIPFRRVNPDELSTVGGKFTLIEGTALKGKLVDPPESVENAVAICLFVINDSKEYILPSGVAHSVEGNEPIDVYEIGENEPVTSLITFPILLCNQPVTRTKGDV